MDFIQLPKQGSIKEVDSSVLLQVLQQHTLPSIALNLLYNNKRPHVPKRTRVIMQ